LAGDEELGMAEEGLDCANKVPDIRVIKAIRCFIPRVSFQPACGSDSKNGLCPIIIRKLTNESSAVK
jgi:hypothetical protein